MKKISVCLLLMVCLFLTGCGENKVKESITIDDFSTITSNNNFVVNSNMDNYKNIDYIAFF